MRWVFNAPVVEPWLESCIRESGVSRSIGHLLRQIPFKDKEEFISEIIKYICAKWELLCHEIVTVFAHNPRRKVIELAVANLRFWIANPNFRSVLMTVSQTGADGLLRFDAPLMQAIDELCGVPEVAEMKKFTVRAMIYGSLTLLGVDGNRTVVIGNFKRKLEEEFAE